MIELKELLRMGVEKKASDIHITVGRAPSFRINGEMAPIDGEELTPEQTKQYARECLGKEKFDELVAEGEVDCSMTVPRVSRFRVNAFYQRGSIGNSLQGY